MLAVLALLVTLSGPAVYYFLLHDDPWLRATGLPSFAVMALGIVLGFVAVRRRRTLSARLLFGTDVSLAVLWAVVFFVLLRLPPPAADFERLAEAPDFMLPDHDGRPVALREARAKGPVLLVFYRGHW